jgi:hypothetical protein
MILSKQHACHWILIQFWAFLSRSVAHFICSFNCDDFSVISDTLINFYLRLNRWAAQNEHQHSPALPWFLPRHWHTVLRPYSTVILPWILLVSTSSSHNNRITSSSAFCLIVSCYMLGLLLNPEDGGSTFPRDVDERLPDYTAWHSRRHYNVGIVHILLNLIEFPRKCSSYKRIGTWHEQMSFKVQSVPKNENRAEIETRKPKTRKLR